MRGGVAYVKQTEEAYARQVRDRLERQFLRRARELGYEVTRVEPADPAGSAEPAWVS